MFHSHWYIESDTNKEIIYCQCGGIKSLHQHKWQEIDSISERNRDTGVTRLKFYKLKCELCGDIKLVAIDD